MAITSTGFEAPATAREGLKPSVYDNILLVGRRDCPLINLIGSETITNPIRHSWHIDTLRDPINEPKEEIHELVSGTKSTVQKNSNAVQILTTVWEVSESMEKAQEYGKQNPKDREKGKRAIEHANNLEYALFGLGHDTDAKVSVFTAPLERANETDKPISAGFFHFIAKNDTTFTNGRRGNIFAFDNAQDWTGTEEEMTEEMFCEILQSIWDSGAQPKDVFVGAALKRRINAWRAKNNVTNFSSKDANLIVDTIETDFGRVRVHLHRYLSAAHGLGDVLLAGDFEYMKNGLYIPTNHKEVPTSRTSIMGRFYTEFCLCVKNADAFAIGVGLK